MFFFEALPETCYITLKQKYKIIDLSKILKKYKTIAHYWEKNEKKHFHILKECRTILNPYQNQIIAVIFRTHLIIDKLLIDIFENKVLFLRAGSGYDNIDSTNEKTSNLRDKNKIKADLCD